jgi:hypothetical protein
MGVPPPRIVTLVLVNRDGTLLGQLPPFAVATPWWQDAAPVVNGAHDEFGLRLTVLRVLETELAAPHGGRVTYLAEVDPEVGRAAAAASFVRPWSGSVTDDPLRLPYAHPGGPAADLAWADSVLATRGIPRTGRPEQIRTWNLSSLWRLPTARGGAWLKVVPPFFAHEGRVLERLAGEAVPELLGRDGARLLLAELPGDDQYDAEEPRLLEMVDILVDLQRRWLGRVEALRGLGLPDWRGPALSSAVAQVIERAARDLAPDDRTTLDAFVKALPRRLSAIEACGFPDGLVHGDFHPGNVRGTPGRLVLLDWGDSGVGHPLLDQPAFLTRIGDREVAMVRAHWHQVWRTAVPGADPDRAASLLAPLAAARQAVIYQQFLDQIETSEHAYHRADVPDWLERTAAILRTERIPPAFSDIAGTSGASDAATLWTSPRSSP